MSQAQTLKNFLSVQKKGSINTKDSVTKKRALTILDAALLEAPPVKKTRTSLRLSSKLETKELPSTEFAEPEAKDTSSVLSGPTQNIIDRILTRSRRKLVQPKLAGFINSPEPSSDKVKEIQNVTKDVAKLIESNFSFDNVLDTEAINRSENDVKLPADNCLESKAEISAANKSTDSDTVEALEPIKKVPGYIKYRHLLQSTPSNDSHSKAQEAPKETTLVSANTTPKTTVPGFKKHGHLLAGKIELPLPEKFETLEKIFHALHHTIVFFKSQNLNCVYHRMKKPVENMCNRTFTLDHLAQIKTVYPEAFRYEALKYMHQGQRIESVLLEVDDAEEKLYDNQTNIYETLKLAGSKLELRLKEFRRRLINIVKAEHEDRDPGRI
ncbi:hypothetical protein K7432_014618 [Basidiobolus ranarum]|uniref:CDT1 Geminin-binding domain-containing protein n=1 Tax=Basidiobolus ranarum TaxID=34480 RepID=A0ABR2VP65_9FUNG